MAFNQGSYDSLKSLSRPIHSPVLIFETHGKGTLFARRLNESLPSEFTDKILTDIQANEMLLECGNVITFLLPDNRRD
jgi:hypothetical protein